MSNPSSGASALPLSNSTQDAAPMPTRPQLQFPAATAWSPLVPARNPLRALPFRPRHTQSSGDQQEYTAPQPELEFSLPIRTRPRTININVGDVLDLNNAVGRAAVVAVIEDVAREMREEFYINESDFLIKECREACSHIDYDNDIIDRPWSALHIALRSTHLHTAGKFQRIVQRVAAANKTRAVRTETELARMAEDLLRDVQKYPEAQRHGDTLAQRVANIVHDKSVNAATCRKEVEVIAKKSTLLALLYRYTDNNVDVAVNELVDDDESLVDDSAPAECT